MASFDIRFDARANGRWPLQTTGSRLDRWRSLSISPPGEIILARVDSMRMSTIRKPEPTRAL